MGSPLFVLLLLFAVKFTNELDLPTNNSLRLNVVVILYGENSHYVRALAEGKQTLLQRNINQTYNGNWMVNFETRRVMNGTASSPANNLQFLFDFMNSTSVHVDGVIFLGISHRTILLSSLLKSQGIPTIGLFTDEKDHLSTESNTYFSRVRTSSLHSYIYVMKDIMHKMGWRTLCLVTTADLVGLKFAEVVTYFVLQEKWILRRTIWIDLFYDNQKITTTLREIKRIKPDVVVMYGRSTEAREFLKRASNMTGVVNNFAWIVTEHTTDGIPVEFLPPGILRVNNKKDTIADDKHTVDTQTIYDSMGLFQSAFTNTLTSLCSSKERGQGCHRTGRRMRRAVDRYISKTSYSGLSYAFNIPELTDKPLRAYDIWNFRQDALGNRHWTHVGLWTPSGLALDSFSVDPGTKLVPPVLPPKPILRVPVVSTPAWMKVAKPQPDGQSGICLNGEQCFVYNISGNSSKVAKTKYCCAGTQIDLINLLQQDLGFVAEIYFSPDGKWGTRDGQLEEWNGLMKELVTGNGDVIALLGISNQRSIDVDFTYPYLTLGLNILVKKVQVDDRKLVVYWNFLEPFSWELWTMIVASCNIILLVIWGLDRISPTGNRRKLQILEQDEIPIDDGFTLLDSMSYVWGVAFSKDIGAEKTPRGPSARFVSIFFAFMALILVSTYCANLTAFLLQESIILPIEGITDKKLVSPPNGFKLGVVRGSFEESYFRNNSKDDLQLLYDVNIKINLVKDYDEGIKQLKDGTLDGLVGDDVSLQTEANGNDCAYSLTGKSFYALGIAFAFSKGSPWIQDANLSVLKNQENGTIDRIKKLRFPNNTCKKIAKVRDFRIADFSGLFVTVIIVVALGLLAVFVEVFVVIILIKYKDCMGPVGIMLRQFLLGVREDDARSLSVRASWYTFGKSAEKSWNVNVNHRNGNTDPDTGLYQQRIDLGLRNNAFIVSRDLDNGVSRMLQRNGGISEQDETPEYMENFEYEIRANCSFTGNRSNNSKRSKRMRDKKTSVASKGNDDIHAYSTSTPL